MPTTRDIIERAYRKIGVVAIDEPMTADQEQEGLSALNDMLYGWALSVSEGIETDVTLASEFPIERMFHEGVVYQLADRLAPNFGMQGFNTDDFMRKLQQYYVTIPRSSISAVILRTATQSRGRL